MVAISALVSRYEPGVQSVYDNTADDSRARTANWLLNLCSKSDQPENHDATLDVSQTTAYRPIIEKTEEPSNDDRKDCKREANKNTSFCVKLSVFCLVAGIACLAMVLTRSVDRISEGVWWALFLICLSSGTIVVSLLAIQLQPRNSATFPFMVSGIPYLSAITIFINAVLIANLQWMTYLRFGVWMTLGKLRDTYALLFSKSCMLLQLQCFLLHGVSNFSGNWLQCISIQVHFLRTWYYSNAVFLWWLWILRSWIYGSQSTQSHLVLWCLTNNFVGHVSRFQYGIKTDHCGNRSNAH